MPSNPIIPFQVFILIGMLPILNEMQGNTLLNEKEIDTMSKTWQVPLWVRNIQISHKLRISYAVICFIMILTVTGGIWAVSILNQNIIDTHTVSIKSLHINALRADTLRLESFFRQAVIEIDPTYIQQANVLVHNELEIIQSDYSIYQRDFPIGQLSPDEQKAEKTYDKAYAAWFATLQQMEKLTTVNDAQSKGQLDTTLRYQWGPQSDAINSALGNWMAIGIEQIQSTQQNATQVHQNIIIAQTILIIIAIAVALAIAQMVTWFITKPIKDVEKIILRISDGDLTIDDDEFQSSVGRDQIGVLASGVQEMSTNLKNLIIQLKMASQTIVDSTGKLTDNTAQTDTATSQVSLSIRQVAQGSQEQSHHLLTMSRQLDILLDQGNRVQEYAATSRQFMDELKSKIVQGAERIQLLSEHSQQISKILTKIEEIADQTNLLALNAAIEAARANESGRGFAVVADEVRKLAVRSSSSTQEIVEIIHKTQMQTNETVVVMQEGLEKVEHSVSSVADSYKASVTMIDGIQKLNLEISSVTAVSQENSAVAEEVMASSEEMARQIHETLADIHSLQKIVSVMDDTTQQFTLPSDYRAENKAWKAPALRNAA